jgi:hypothetical protein
MSWTQLTPTASPSTRAFAAEAYDPATGQLLLFGGSTQATPQLAGDTWVWQATTWTELSPTHSPSPRTGAALAYDPATRSLVLFGGVTTTGSRVADTWEWNGSDWTELTPADSPPPRAAAAMTFDPATEQMVMFGGYDGQSYLGDTWLWDGTDWSAATPTASPSPRATTVAYDDDTSQLVLYGGGDGTPLTDTWLWDGTTWTQAATTSAPDSSDGTLAFDVDSQQLLDFGGDTSAGFRNGLWAWTGTDWMSVTATGAPTARFGDTLAYDSATSQLVMFGGLGAAPVGDDDTWTLSPTAPSVSNPTLTATVHAAKPMSKYGWYRTPVVVSFTCNQGSAPVITCPSAVALSRDMAAGSVTRTVTATDGGQATATAGPVNIDTTPPVVRVRGVVNGHRYPRDARPRPTCISRDALSGIASCQLTQTRTSRKVRYRAAARDRAGNTTIVTGHYRLI